MVVALAAIALVACATATPKAPVSPPLATAPAAGQGAAAFGGARPADADAAIPVGTDDASWGSPAALVTIVEFADFECPFCAGVAETLSRVRDTYGPDKVRLVWKNDPLPFHANAKGASEAAEGVRALAGADAFWRFYSLAFKGQRDLGPEAYARWASEAGVRDADAFRSGLSAHTWAAKVDADLALAKKLGVVGTPWFFVNGVRISGAQPFDEFRDVIDEQIVAAHAKLAKGTPPDQLYAVLSRENAAAQPADDDEDDDPPEDTRTVYKVPVGKSPVRGGPNALVTIVEFADYQCPFCARVEPTLRGLLADYGDKVRLVFKDAPLSFHARAEPAAEAALEVRAERGDAAFFKMHDLLFDHPGKLGEDALVEWAQSAGARPDEVRAAMAKHRYRAVIEADGEVADDFGADGTPHFFINGRRLVGAQPRERFAAIIDEEVGKARAMLDAGTKAEGLYDALTKNGQGAPEPERKDATALPAGDPARGPDAAKVTIHEFADFQCPFCARAEATLKAVSQAYGDRVRFVWHDYPLPFHDSAMAAARGGREARRQRGNVGFWALHDKLFSVAKLTRDELDGAARSLGLDMDRWRAAVEATDDQVDIEADRHAADRLDFRGTPSFLVVPAGAATGYVIVGAQGYPKFHKLVERAVAEARR